MQSEYKRNFQEIRSLSSGGFSTVFEAKSIKDGNIYAIKKIPFKEEEMDKTLKEIELLRNLESVYIVKYYNSWVESNYYDCNQIHGNNNLFIDPKNQLLLHIQMELCSMTLDVFIKSLNFSQKNSINALQFSIACEVFIQLLECVQFLHSHKPPIIHRDLKPQNILLTNGDNNRCVKLTDFGLSTFHEFEDQSHISGRGTAFYKAPEVINRQYSIEADLYSIGRTMLDLFNIDLKSDSIQNSQDFQSKYEILITICKSCLSTIIIARPSCEQILNNSNDWKFNQNINNKLSYKLGYKLSKTKDLNMVCIALSKTQKEMVSKLINTVKLDIPCPQSINGLCNAKSHLWYCSECEDCLEYGFDENFYCLCGRANAFSYEFKCNSNNQINDFIKFFDRDLKHYLININKEINILILGETGVGKSTFINAFANYNKYSSLIEAKNKELLSPIASAFTVLVSNFQKRVIFCGEDKNEEFIAKKSSSISPKSYKFNYNNKIIRFIDTRENYENFEEIIGYLLNIEKIHGICILMKPNNSNIDLIMDILSHLHRDASSNILFCFTNTRSSFYRPGDSMLSLESLLKENRKFGIKISKDTIYCVENESFRFLCALNNIIEFEEENCDSYLKSWDKSMNETKRMLDYISKLIAHEVKKTLFLNYTQKVILNLSISISDIDEFEQNILTNINVIEDKKKDTLNNKEAERKLKELEYTCIKLLENKQELKKGFELQVLNIETFVKELIYEKNMIIKTIANIHVFLSIKSIVFYDYLDVLSRLEKNKVGVGDNRKTLYGLEQMKCLYDEEVCHLNKSITESNGEEMTELDIIILVNKLYALKHTEKILVHKIKPYFGKNRELKS